MPNDGPVSYRSGLPPLPARMKHLPLDHRGYPVPYFVGYVDGLPDFRAADRAKLVKAVNQQRCWLCGDPLGVHRTFVIGPMCAVNRVSSEPPCHLECAEYAVEACPFLLHPNSVRREANLPEESVEPAGIMIKRNPGVTLLWTTKTYKIERHGNGVLFRIGDPSATAWIKQGRPATREEVMESIDSGLPLLMEMATKDGPDALLDLAKMTGAAMRLLPQETSV